MALLKNLPTQLVMCVILAFLIGSSLEVSTVRFCYTLSCLLKEYLMAILPFVIMSYIASAILSLEQKAPLLILTIILLVCASNILAAQAAYYVGIIGLPLLAGGKLVGLSQIQETITPLVSFPDMEILSPSFSMIIGMIYGLIFGIKRNAMAQNLAFKVRDFVTVLLQKSFIPLLPVYVFGFVLKMQKEGTLTILFENCGQIILLMCGFMLTYILLAYVLVYRGNPKLFIPALKNMFPPIFTGFTTMSSAATMPVTLVGVEKNLKDPQFAQLIVPTTVNIHMLGDTLGIPLLALAVLQLSGLPLPDTLTYLSFTLYFCITKFSVAGIPGGGVLVCLPILQEHLGLPPEMGPLVATLYILQDSIFTSSNVAGNGVFALICHRVLTRIRLVKQVPQIQEEAYAPLPESPDFYTQPKRKADL